ncbi:MAG: hypothetical protein EXR69_12035 [Myxococcales bacterium]|nr:hypothetical protein [Myxococcales bacterium]
MPLLALPVTLVVACLLPVDGPGRARESEAVDSSMRDSAATDSSAPPVERDSIADQPETGLDDWFFSTETVHTIAITLPPEGEAALALSPYDKTLGDISIDGVALFGVGVRLRGKVGSFRELSGKPKFAIDLNYTNVDQRFYGIEELSLNNEVIDCSYLKEPLAYRIFRDAGVPAPRTGFARVSVNGADYGLYVIVETPDDQFLKGNFADSAGNLYDGKYLYYEDHTYTLLDFTTATQDLFQLEEGTDVGHADVHAVVSAVPALGSASEWYDAANAVMDLRLFETYITVEQLVGHNDGYSLNTNNYRFYFDPLNGGRMSFIPWDFDYGFLHDYEWGYSWQRPRGVLAAACIQNARCATEHKDAVRSVLATFDAAALQVWFDQMQSLIANDATTDPRRECAIESVAATQAAVRSWLDTEPANLKAAWGVE